MQLSTNFHLNEMTRSQTALRRGIDNTPDAATVERLRTLCLTVLQPVRDHFARPLTVNSGYRCPELNAAIGSQPTSQHIRGEAADVEIPGLDNRVVAEYIRDHLDFDQLILEFYEEGEPSSGWVHVSYVSPEKNRKVCLRINSSGTHPGL